MKFDEYSKKRDAILKLFDKYKKAREENSNDAVDMELLENKVDNLKNNKFLVAVVGEVSSGKSTFLNVLLGDDILPTDILQNTSDIIEIFEAKEQYLEVRYADGHIEKIEDDLSTPEKNEAYDKLKEIAAVKEEYRDLPVAILKHFLVEHGGQYNHSHWENLLKEECYANNF